MYDVAVSVKEKIAECFKEAIHDAVDFTVGDDRWFGFKGKTIQDFIFEISDYDFNKLESVIRTYKEFETQWEAKKPVEPSADADHEEQMEYYGKQFDFYTDCGLEMCQVLCKAANKDYKAYIY